MSLRTIVALALLMAFGACAPTASSVPAAKPALPEPVVDTRPLHVDELGRIDTTLLDRIAATRYIDHIKVAFAADGGLRKLAIYHNDPDPIPAEVRKVLHEKFPQHHILNYETEWEREDGAITEVALRLPDQRMCELSCLNDGRVRYIECLISPESLPKEVTDAVHRTLPEAEIGEAEMRTDETGDHYKVTARQGRQQHVLMLRPDGTLNNHRLKISAVMLVDFH